MKVDKSLWWGAMPWEQDGGAVVNYYLMKMMNYLEPKHEFHAVPKVPTSFEPAALPFVEFFTPHYNNGGAVDNQHLYKEIPSYMLGNNIPLMVMFHIDWEYFPMASFVKAVGGKTLVHQTVHWNNDVLFKSKVLGNVDSWVAPTKWAANQLLRYGKIKRDKIKYIPHGVNMERFYPHGTTFRKYLNIKPDQKVILFTGRCSLEKGLHQLIPVMRPIIKDYNAVFVIRASVHPLLEKSMDMGFILDSMARHHKWNIRWIHSWTSPEAMEELTASCDILVQPSGHEGFDVPLVEAMACKKAIAVTNIPNHKEIMGGKNRECGIFMEPTVNAKLVNDGQQMIKVPSSDCIEGTLRYLLENPDECEYFASHGYERAKRNYNLAKVANKWLDHFDSLSPEEAGNLENSAIKGLVDEQ
jgi:glycosyltransferase involved in cell wall biosynthesis